MPEFLTQNHQRLSLLGLFALAGLAASCSPNNVPIRETPTTTPTATEIPMATATATTTSTATATATASPASPPTTAPPKNIYSEVRDQMRSLSKQLRSERKRANPQKWARQIIPENENLDPTLFEYGCGDDLQSGPNGEPRQVTICPNRLHIFGENQVYSFSVTHDLGVVKDGQPGNLVRSDRLWLDGNNFETVRDGWQKIYRAPIDLIVVMNNQVILDVVKDGLGNRLTIDNPVAFTAQSIWLNGKLTDEWDFPAGVQTLDGVRTMQFATATPKTTYAPIVENQPRLDVLGKSLIKEVARRKKEDPKSLFFLTIPLSADYMTGKIKSDSGADQLAKLLLSILSSPTLWDLPQNLFGDSVYLVAPQISPTPNIRGVAWATADTDPYIKKAGIDPFFFEIPDWTEICASRPPGSEPCGANFYSPDPENDYYWPISQAFLAWAHQNLLYNPK